MTESNPKSWKSVTTAALLFFVFCSAGFFAGFQNGRRAGVDDVVAEQVQQIEQRRTAVFSKTLHPSRWCESRLERNEFAYNLTLDAVELSHEPTRWSGVSGNCRRDFGNPLLFMVEGHERGQAEVRAYLMGYYAGAKAGLESRDGK